MGKEQFIGTWRLVSVGFRSSDGKVDYPLGEDATGLLIYDENGYMSSQMRKPGRPLFVARDRTKGTLEEIKTAFEGYYAYYGTYGVDEKERTVTHFAEGSAYPNEEGRALKRYYEFKGEQLTLSTPSIPLGGGWVIGVLIWKRAKPVEKRHKQP